MWLLWRARRALFFTIVEGRARVAEAWLRRVMSLSAGNRTFGESWFAGAGRDGFRGIRSVGNLLLDRVLRLEAREEEQRAAPVRADGAERRREEADDAAAARLRRRGSAGELQVERRAAHGAASGSEGEAAEPGRARGRRASEGALRVRRIGGARDGAGAGGRGLAWRPVAASSEGADSGSEADAPARPGPYATLPPARGALALEPAVIAREVRALRRQASRERAMGAQPLDAPGAHAGGAGDGGRGGAGAGGGDGGSARPARPAAFSSLVPPSSPSAVQPGGASGGGGGGAARGGGDGGGGGGGPAR
jgi:hypothetical protein